jgi:hypothetical protein
MVLDDDVQAMLHPKPRKRPPRSEFRQILMRNIASPIIDHDQFDAGNLHARWIKRGRENLYVVLSYEVRIAQFEPTAANPRVGQWFMIHVPEPTPTTRKHIKAVQAVVGPHLYNAQQ